MDAQSHHYSDLDPESCQIRIVHLLPGENDDPIQCELRTLSLDEKPEYQALSYVWGDPDITADITLDNNPFAITTNLYAALRRLRLKLEKRVMWIDALCIDQSSSSERTHQVGLMGRICEECQEAILWFGDQDECGSEQAWTTVEDAPKRPWHNYPSESFSWDFSDSFDTTSNDMLTAFVILYMFSSNIHIRGMPYYCQGTGTAWGVSDKYVNGLRSLNDFMKLPYWSRIWVVQEMILPPRATVVFGCIATPWQVFADAADSWWDHTGDCCYSDSISLITWQYVILDKVCVLVEDIARARRERKSRTGLTLLDLLVDHANRISSDPLDKVYALLGLLDNTSSDTPLVPEYTISSREAYERVMLHIISTRDDLSIFGNFLFRKSTFPSWVCDWSSVSHNNFLLGLERFRQFNKLYTASDCNRITIRLFTESRLLVAGTHIDTIAGLGGTILSEDIVATWDDLNQDLWALERVMELAGLRKGAKKAYIGGGAWDDAYWRTFCADLMISPDGNSRRIVPKDKRLVKAAITEYFRTSNESKKNVALHKYLQAYKSRVSRAFRFSKLDQTDIDEVHTSIIVGSLNQRFFVTNTGYLGTGPKDIQTGDEVYVINGCKVPLVLRKETPHFRDQDNRAKEHTTDPTYPHFRIVGGCYTHGIMDGEAVRDQTKESHLVLC